MPLTSSARYLLTVLVLGLMVGSEALAEPAEIAPREWVRAEQGENVIFRAPDRNELMIFHDLEGADSPRAIAEAASVALAKAWDGDLSGSIGEIDGVMAVYAFEMSGGGKSFAGRSYAFEKSPGAFFSMVHVAPVGADGLEARIAGTERKMAELVVAANGFVAKAEAPAPATRPQAGPAPEGGWKRCS